MLSLQEHLYDYALLPYPAGSKVDWDSLLDFADFLHSKQKVNGCDVVRLPEGEPPEFQPPVLLTFVEWLSLARHLLGLEEDVAKVYYETYVMIRKPAPPGEEADVSPPMNEGMRWWLQCVLLPAEHWTRCPAVPAVEFMLFLVNQLRGRGHKRVVGRDDKYPAVGLCAAACEDSARSSIYDVLVGSPKNSKEDLRELNDGREQAVAFWRQHIAESVALLVVTRYGKEAFGHEGDEEAEVNARAKGTEPLDHPNRPETMDQHLDVMSLCCISTKDIDPLDFVFFSVLHEKCQTTSAPTTELERKETEASWRLSTVVDFFGKLICDTGRTQNQMKNATFGQGENTVRPTKAENVMCIKEMEELVSAYLITRPLAIHGTAASEDDSFLRSGSDSSSTKSHSRSSSLESKELKRDIKDIVAQMAVSSPKSGGPSDAFSRSSSSSSVNQGGSAQGSPRASPTNSPLSSLPGSPRLVSGSMAGVNLGSLPPQSIFPGITLLSRKKGRTIVVYPNVASGKTVFINRIQDAHVYLLAPVRHVTISNCRDVTIFVSAVSSIIHMRACDRAVIIAACGRFSATRCAGLHTYLFTPTRPMLFCGSAALGEDVATRNTDVIFAPHSAAGFPWAKEHLRSAHIDTSSHENNCWNRPLVAWPAPSIGAVLEVLSSDGLETEDDGQAYEFLPPSEFYTFHVPFVALPSDEVFSKVPNPLLSGKSNADEVHLDANTLSIPVASDPVQPPPCPAPPEYESVQQAREAIVPAYRAALKAAAQISPESVVQLHPIIENAFRMWISGPGENRWDQVSQIIELRKNFEKRRAVMISRLAEQKDEANVNIEEDVVKLRCAVNAF